MTITNPDNLPMPLVRALQNDKYNKGDCDVSVTELIAPPRMVELKRQHRNELTESATDALYRLYGQITHTILERAADSSIVERRYFAKMRDWTVSGQVDLIENVITDYKMTSVWSVRDGHKQEYIDQLRLLRWLCDENGVKVNGLQNVLLFRDWRPGESRKYDWYPPKVLVMPVEMVTASEDRSFAESKVLLHQNARINLPECSDEDRWLRNGKYMRCQEYCSAYQWCLQANPPT